VIALQVADVVLIASRVLDLDSDTVLDLIDVDAAEAALAAADAEEPSSTDQPACPAAALLSALLQNRPFEHGNEPVALVATAQFLALNRFVVDLEPPTETRSVVDDVAAGRMETSDLAEWLAARVSMHPDVTAAAGQRGDDEWGRDPFDRFTDRARKVVILAQDEARRLGHNNLGTEHVLLGLVEEGKGVAALALASLGIGPEDVRQQIAEIVGKCGQTPSERIPFTPRARRAVLEYPLWEARQFGSGYVGTEHLLLGLIRETDGVGAQVLVNLGADDDRVRSQVIRLLSGQPPEKSQAALDLPRYGWIDPAVVVKEIHQLRGEVERLRNVLRLFGIEPDDGPPQATRASHRSR
jgi:hypothetical protein